MTEVINLPTLHFNPETNSYETSVVPASEPLSTTHDIAIVVIEGVESIGLESSDTAQAGKVMKAIEALRGPLEAAGVIPEDLMIRSMAGKGQVRQEGQIPTNFRRPLENLSSGYVSSAGSHGIFRVMDGNKNLLSAPQSEGILVPISTALSEDQRERRKKISMVVIRPDTPSLLEEKKAA